MRIKSAEHVMRPGIPNLPKKPHPNGVLWPTKPPNPQPQDPVLMYANRVEITLLVCKGNQKSPHDEKAWKTHIYYLAMKPVNATTKIRLWSTGFFWGPLPSLGRKWEIQSNNANTKKSSLVNQEFKILQSVEHFPKQHWFFIPWLQNEGPQRLFGFQNSIF